MPSAAAYARWVVRWRWPVLILSLLLMLGAGAGGRYLGFATDYRIFFGKDNPELQAFEALQQVYGTSDNVMFVLTPSSGEVFEPATLRAVAALTEGAWKLPYSSRVDSITNFQHTRADGDDLLIEDLVPNPDAPAATLARAREIALAEPLLRHQLISERAHVTAVNVNLRLPRQAPDEVPRLMAAARALAAEIEAGHPGLDIRLTGIAPLNAAFDEASRTDMSTLIPLMYLVLLVAVALMLRSVGAVLATLSVIALSVITAMGTAGWLGIWLSPPAAMAPTIIMTLAIADSIHILVTFFQQMRQGASRAEAIVESLRVNFSPVFLTSVTTIIGFLSLNTSDAPPFHDLGNITAIGVAAAWLYSVTFLPALVAVLPLRVPRKPLAGTGLMERLAEWVIARRNRLLWGTVVVMLGSLAFIPGIVLDDKSTEYFDPAIAFRADTDYTQANLTGLDLLEYSVPANGVDGINEPQYLASLAAFVDWLRAQPEVAHVRAVSDTVQRLNKSMHGDDPAWYRIPDDRELAAQYLLLYEMSVPFGLDLNNQINVDKSATRVTVTLNSASSAEIRDFDRKVSQWLRDHAPAYMGASGSGGSLMFANISKRNINSMLGGTLAALILISGILIFALRDLKLGLISLAPNLLPAGIAFGIWGLTVGQVGLGVSFVAAVSLGIVVDDTIHFLSKYARARREKHDNAEEAVRYAFGTVGFALLVTTLVLAAGFLVLTFSNFTVNADLGLLTAITVVVALLVDFLFLPPLLMKLEEKNHEAPAIAAAA